MHCYQITFPYGCAFCPKLPWCLKMSQFTVPSLNFIPCRIGRWGMGVKANCKDSFYQIKPQSDFYREEKLVLGNRVTFVKCVFLQLTLDGTSSAIQYSSELLTSKVDDVASWT
uniref:Uncharacterized protein n=1 Tax=Cacopsylla melanoneura TaxID=428564 RepID=A0A8D8UJ39_9HEMI